MNINELFLKILSDSLKLKNFSVHDDMKAKDIPGWSSLNHLMVIVALENGFKIRFTAEEALQAQNIGELKEIIARKISP